MRCEASQALLGYDFRSRDHVKADIQEAKKGQAGIRPGLLGESAQIKLLGAGTTFRFFP